MSPLKDWLNLFAVSVSASVSAAIFEKFLCHDITNVNAANSEMFRVNTFVNFSFPFIERKYTSDWGDQSVSLFQSLGCVH